MQINKIHVTVGSWSPQVFESNEKVSEKQSTDAVLDEDLQPSATQGNIPEETEVAEQEATETSQDDREAKDRSPNQVESSAASTDPSQDSSHSAKTEENVPSSNLLTDVYQITVIGADVCIIARFIFYDDNVLLISLKIVYISAGSPCSI